MTLRLLWITSRTVTVSNAAQNLLSCFFFTLNFLGLFCSAVSSETSVEEGWDTEDIEIPDEDLPSKDTSDAKTLMDEAKAGRVEELQPPSKVT